MSQHHDHSTVVRNQLSISGLQEILDLDGITEVAINEPGGIWFDRGNGWEFKEEPELTLGRCQGLAKSLAVYSRITTPLEEYPIASVTLPDGERGQIAIHPATEKDIVSMTFRKPSTDRFSLNDYQNSGRFDGFGEMNIEEITLSDTQKKLIELKRTGQIEEFFRLAVKSKLNILIVGGTGSGKTTVMKAMVDCYPTDARIITIEDVHELDLPNHRNHLHLFYKQGGVTPKIIIESCMRMKPDHVLLAELRGDEAWTYLEMLNTGHDGSITTIHANDCRSAPSRLAGLVKQSPVGKTLDYDHIMTTIKKSIDVIVFFKKTHLVELYFNPTEKNKLSSKV
ncbi:P-type DNA transfer ATPase VirB11 [Vibrio tubiashii]|uniref:Type IV secretion system protein n=1 Tax=Vibrio tubiashii ATCC 19109 TaxID=1051646 RepID=F9T6U3_9VIBR|nr:P-type DNA transfer ATPase VirB11 [Vibrio tubiashii]AIW17506.1 secretion system protein E [Vibrio tubiashii ATCC 19109]EGU54498.1 type II secretion system protein E [Vibrio tubiashii ATCC 19109]EIF01277.1 type II secretion system protein E [Vibrio tubiashii NCIMB 1337 = ATCC 19106]